MATLKSYDVIGLAEDVSNVISNISPSATPFLSAIGTEKVSARKFEWLEDSLRASVANNALVEGADASMSSVDQPTLRDNATQIIGEAFQVANTVEAVSKYGRGKEVAYNLAKVLKSLKSDYEKSCIGVSQAKVDTNGSTARRMASIDQQITTSVDAGANATDPLTEAKVLDLHQDCYENGSEPTMLIVKPADASIVASFATATGRQREIDAKTLTNVIEVILTPFGELRVMISRNILSTHAFMFDPSMFKQCVLRPFTRTLLSVTGDSSKHFVVGEMSIKHMNFGDSGMITGLS